MDKYIRVDNKDKNQPQNKDQIRVRAGDHSIYPYLSYAHRHFDEGNTAVIIKATGNAISRAVQVVELIKRRFKGLHQENEITSLEVEDVYEPTEQGLDTVTRTRRLTMLACTLSKKAIDENHYGYQEPLPVEQIQQFQPGPQRGAPRQFRQGPRYYNRGGYYGGRGGGNPRDYERGPRYRGGGRGGYGHGGGYNNNRNYNQRREDAYRQDYDDDFEEQRPRGRGYRGGRDGYRPRVGYNDGYRRDGDNRRDGNYGSRPRDGGDYGPRPRDGGDYGQRARDGEEQPRNEQRYHQGGYQGEKRYYNDSQREGQRNDDRYREGPQGGYYNRGPQRGARGYYRGRGRGQPRFNNP